MNETANMATYRQTARFLQIETPLGPDQVLLTEVDGYDAISRPFVFNVELVTQEADATIRKLLSQAVTLTLHHHREGAAPHCINGVIRRLTGCNVDIRGLRHWRAEVVPKLWLLSCTADCRIFQNKSVPDILDKVFGEHGLTKYEIRASRGDYPKLEYCVQYRETTFDFVSRLMERSGMFYWHEHTADSHTLVIADHNVHAKVLDGTVVVLGDRPIVNDVQTMRHDYTFRPGQWTLRDFDFEAPAKNLTANTVTVADITQMAQHEIYDYPGGYTDQQVGKALTRRLIEAEEVQYDRLCGAGTAAGLDAGRRCEARFADPNTSRDDDEFLLTEVRHQATDHSYITDVVEPATYTNEFVATPVKVPFRPPQWTPRPIVRGPQTAIVTGPADEQIYTDKYGRVKVRFPWDRNPDGNQDDVSSCWIRVSQGWAGRNWGAIHLPRVGQEVIVDFLEGDPDRPIITGRVYNGTNSVPYELPANATQSGIKSRSVLGSGSNEFRFEDKRGSEEVWLHAQKDLNAKVENNETRDVGSNRTTTIRANETKTVDGNVLETVKGTETRNITGNVSESFSANETRTISGNVSETIEGAVSTRVGGSVSETIGGSISQNVADGITVTTTGKINITAVGGFSVLAPGGTRYVDDFFDKTGTTNSSAYAVQFSTVGTQTQYVGISATTTGVNLSFNLLNVGSSVIEQSAKVTKLETAATHIKQGIVSLYNQALVTFS